MINHVWSVLCRRTVVDQATNNVSLFDVFEQLQIDATLKKDAPIKEIKKLNVPIDYVVASFWVKEDPYKKFRYKGEVRLEIIDPKGNVGKTFVQTLDMPEDMKRVRTLSQIKGLVVEEPGVYRFQVSFRNDGEEKFKKVATLPLEIIINKTTEKITSVN